MSPWKRTLAVVLVIVVLGQVSLYASEDSDSDVEYDTTHEHRAPPRRAVRREPLRQTKQQRQQQVAENSEDEFDEVEKEEEAPDEDGEPPKPKRRMLRRYETQSSFVMEACFILWLMMAGGLYFKGTRENAAIVKKWISQHEGLLHENFTLVGDDGNFDEDSQVVDETKPPRVMRDNHSNYTLYCSGRRHCSSCMFAFELCSRQDLISTIYNFFTNAKDEMVLTFELEERDMPEPFTVAVVPARGHKDLIEKHLDLKHTVVKGTGYKGLPKSVVMMCDAEGPATTVISEKVRELISSNVRMFNSIHITDDSPFPETRLKRVARFRFNIPPYADLAASKDKARTMVAMAFHIVDRIPRAQFTTQDVNLQKKLRKARDAKKSKAERQEREETVAAKKSLEKKKKQEALEKRLDQMPSEQRRREELKIAKKEEKKNNKKKNNKKMMMISM